MPAAAEVTGHRRGVHRVHAAARHQQHHVVKLHQRHHRVAALQLAQLVRQQREFVHVLAGVGGGDEHLNAVDAVGLRGGEQLIQHLALRLGERAVDEGGDDVEIRSPAQQPRHRLRVLRGGGAEGEAAGVLVDAQRENRRVQRVHRDARLAQQAHHQRGVGAAGFNARFTRLNGGLKGRVVVVKDDRHARPADERGEASQPFGVLRLHHDEAGDAVQRHVLRRHQVDEVAMQREELAHVAVRARRQAHQRAGVEQRRRHHAGQRVEIGIGVGDNQVHGGMIPVL
ncbi:MAG: hypothetical protein BWY76_03323 [bacterium ADurb.Bin429]|nr:MAG: hypothetical protein BWY76_03323 [bacterium ADurb.Bin429]